MVIVLLSIAAFLATLAAIALVFGPAEVAILTCVVLTTWSALFLALAFAINFLVDKFRRRRSAASTIPPAVKHHHPEDDDHVDASTSPSSSFLPSLPDPPSQTEVWWRQNRQ